MKIHFQKNVEIDNCLRPWQVSQLLFFFAAIFFTANCTVDNFQYEGRVCFSDYPCAQGYVCENNRCVKNNTSIANIDGSAGKDASAAESGGNIQLDAASSDFAKSDVATYDLALGDSAYLDMNRKDVGLLDVGRKDIGLKDVGRKDIGLKDVGRKDVGLKDVGRKDVGLKDVGLKDVGLKDAGLKDVGIKDVGSADTKIIKDSLTNSDAGSCVSQVGCVTTFATLLLDRPGGIAVDGSNVFFADGYHYRIIQMIGPVPNIIGAGINGYVDGTSQTARFSFISGLAFGPSGYLFIADSENHAIRSLYENKVETMAGTGVSGYQDNDPLKSQFNWPADVAVDSKINIYVSDCNNNRIRLIPTSGNVKTYAGSTAGYVNGLGTAAQFDCPMGLALDTQSSILYVADSNNNSIRKIVPSGTTGVGLVTTLAGINNEFSHPVDVALDPKGNIIVADGYHNQIKRVAPSTGGQVTLVIGSGTAGYLDGAVETAQFNYPYAVAVDSLGRIYVSDHTCPKRFFAVADKRFFVERSLS